MRVSRSFRLIWMRPLFSVVLVPSIPMNDDTLSTSGSCRMMRASSCCRRSHRRKADRLRGLRDAQQHARILHREEALRHDDVQYTRQHKRRQRHQQRHHLVPQHKPHAHRILRNHILEELFALAVERALLVLRRMLQQLRRHHRRQRQRDHRRHQNCHRQRHRKLAEQPAHDIAHEQQRNQHRDQRNRQRQNREADLLRPLQRRRPAGRRPSPGSAQMFSIITIASSTTNPVEIVSAIRLRLFRL